MSDEQKDQSYSWVYGKLVNGETDLVGAIAYVLYKQQKIQCIQTFENEKLTDGEVKLSEQELLHINKLLSTDEAIRGYQDRAEILVTNFLTQALEKDIQRIESEQAIKISEHLKTITGKLENDVSGVSTLISHKFGLIQAEISSKKKWWVYLGEAFLNIICGLLALAIIGGVITGYKFVSKINNQAEDHAGLSSDTQNTKK